MSRRIIDANKGMDFSEEDKKAKIVINGVEYEIKKAFKIKTYDRCNKIIEDEQNYKKAFEEIKKEIFEKEINENKITIGELEKFKIDDDEKIISILLKEEREKQLYEEMEETDVYKKYFKSLEIFWKEMLKSFREPLLELQKQISELVVKPSNLIGNAIKDALNQLATNLEVTIEENKDNLKKFANYGWTSWDDMPMDIFFQEVNSQDEADKLCLEFINEITLEEILKQNKEMSIKNNYIDESIILFKKEHFRACAMLIIAYMDRVISENIVIEDSSKYTKKIGKTRNK